LTTLGVLVALAVVAVASRGSTPVGEAGGRRPSDTLLDIFFTLYLLALQRGLKRKSGVGSVGRLSMLVLFVILMIGLAGARRLQGLELNAPPEEELVPAQGTAEPPEAVTTPTSDAYEPEFAWIPVLVFVGLLAAGLGAVWWAGVRRRRARSTEEPATLGEALADVLDETLDALRAERDPRLAVIRAYARLERVLAAHGLARRPAEAPLEYLGRVLEDLSVSPSAVRQLTILFQRAKFSQHEVGEAMKDEAIEALENAQDDLRAAEAQAQLERERAAQLAVGRTRSAG
jgi:hypothetical protein